MIRHMDDTAVLVLDAIVGDKLLPHGKALFPKLFHPDPVFIVHLFVPQGRVAEYFGRGIPEGLFHEMVYEYDFSARLHSINHKRHVLHERPVLFLRLNEISGTLLQRFLSTLAIRNVPRHSDEASLITIVDHLCRPEHETDLS